MSTASQVKTAADDRRRQAMGRLVELQRLRQQQLDQTLQDQANFNHGLELQAEEKLAADKKNWFDDAAKGAKMGSAFGPWGTLVGGIIGTAKGQYEGIKQRMDEGENFGGAFAKTHFDMPGLNTGALYDQVLSGEKIDFGKAHEESGFDFSEDMMDSIGGIASNLGSQAMQSQGQNSQSGGGGMDFGSMMNFGGGGQQPMPSDSYYSSGQLSMPKAPQQSFYDSGELSMPRRQQGPLSPGKLSYGG